MDRTRKRNLRDLNLRVWAGERDVFPVLASLDSALKKNTAFIKRLRTAISAAGQATLLAEVQSLSLHKYLSELISACFEGICKLKNPSDVAAGVEVVSALHQRFGPDLFTNLLAWYIGRGMTSPDRAQLKLLSAELRDKEERDRLTRQRTLLRVLIELWLAGVLRSLDDCARPDDVSAKSKDDPKQSEHSRGAKQNTHPSESSDPEPFPLEVLKDLLGHDREHVNLPLVVMVAKTFAFDMLGLKSGSVIERKPLGTDTDIDTVTDAEIPTAYDDVIPEPVQEVIVQDTPLTTPETQQRFMNIFTRYFEDVKKHLLRDQSRLTQQKSRNAEVYVKVGDVFEDRQANYEKLVKEQDKLVTNAQALASILGTDMPDLDEKEVANASSDGLVGLVKTDQYLRAGNTGIWDDPEERQFYESLIDVKSRVPSILFEDKKKQAPSDDPPAVNADSTQRTEKNDESLDSSATATATDEQSSLIPNKTIGAQVDALLARLPELSSKDQADQCAIDFCFLNSKASRNRLIKAVQELPKGRIDLLPLYSRLVATLAEPMPDVIHGLVSYLDDEFKSLQRRKTKEFLGPVRMANVRYIAELTKFGVVPEHVIFHCLKVSLDDFSRMNIEIIASLLENCGRYLLRKQDSSARMATFLQALQRKKSSQHLGQQEKMLVENAVYFVDPPERASIEQKERTPVDLYVRRLIYVDLCKRTLEKTIKQLRKLHWEETEVPELMRKIFEKPGKLKYGNLNLFAVVLGSLHRYHQDFATAVIDDLLERIYAGLDHNDFRQNQKRTADVRFLGELYAYRLIDSTVIMESLYGILNHGHQGGYARPDDHCSIDGPEDYFRIRLVASLLETCGMYFDKGLARQKLDFFLAFYQYYIHTKVPAPMDVDFVIQDIFASIRPQWKLVPSFEEANQVFAEACKKEYEQTARPTGQDDAVTSDDAHDGGELDDQGVDTSSDDDAEDASDDEESGHGSVADADGHEPAEIDSDSHADEEEDEELITVVRPEETRDPEADAEFDRELAKLMAESIDSRKSDKRTMFDVPLPLRRTADRATSQAIPDSTTTTEANDSASTAEPPKTMTFSLLSRRGNRQQTRAIDLPSDSTLAMELRSQQAAEKAEQQRIKNLVLNYDLENHRGGDIDGDDNDDDDNGMGSSRYTQQQGHGGSNGGGRRDARAGGSRKQYQARRLQLSDVDW